MKVSIKSDYALRAALELALNYRRKTLGTGEIARRQNIPKRYLEQILLSLKKAGIVNSFRGKAGGYTLAKAPGEIKASDVVQAIEGEISLLPKRRRKKTKDAVLGVWERVQSSVVDVLGSVTLEDLADKAQKTQGTLTYSI